ncbi:NAD-dependent epimerase/dehydratase family protein [Actinoplanes awajinensis]|uniref:Reductase n=1 Tax=Actinoplanes awajinensis subsp. mycoplanecinus TaxID=135947 RepID=A0A101JQ56_9ACTN|nr:NAD-dependent epimerase/dehydratase family protein [Actinoplanes awajinensis]KUL31019.1 reductase [Actinoplanes awajinensis subsp. mycoplanecinus]
MRILILGGSGFVGRALADEALAAGHDVTVFNRGQRDPVPGTTTLLGDRLADGGLTALATGTWDAVVDTWSAQASAVGTAAALLAGRAGHFAYVSSRSVYRWLSTDVLTEDAPLTDLDDPGYAGDKLRGEQATAAFGGPVLFARAGLILGPHEDVGRLPWWLHRLHRGGPTLAPGPRDLPLQYVDARDLALFLLANVGVTGAFNVVSESGHATMGSLLDTANEVTGGHAELRWTDPDRILAAGVEPWTDLPIWLPPGDSHDFMHRADVSKALAAGLRCRPVRETVADTWAWLSSLPGAAPQRTDRPSVGLAPAAEEKLLLP